MTKVKPNNGNKTKWDIFQQGIASFNFTAKVSTNSRVK